ncbi:hypothetical protein [Paraburkholderia phenoliruptrix]|uniref:hypothetical protein n=1 Tax=Paraburkholderia phenoliruptrix TaxID=252970 RepID=UPI001C6F516E|nr:hypothetical protein [Paraburkholderia phenoliruptrix]MBW9102923.1 hypothetical protein [Paraburkholderia phenoliruptrix]MBW9132897.1 hypothetical protein [Paraburkholderia ginsengiterrae]
MPKTSKKGAAARPQINAGLVEAAIRRHVDPRGANTLIPEAEIRYGVGSTRGVYRADFMMITRSNYATELEVKVSLADWRKDLSKPKWVGMPDWITRFIYVVPEQLGIPEWVPAHAGVWHLVPSVVDPYYNPALESRRPDGYQIIVARAPHVLGRQKLPAAVLGTWLRNLYYRYWEQRVHLEGRIARHVREGVSC